MRALWRHRRVVAAGLGGAVLLALLSYVSVNPLRSPIFEHRQSSMWSSSMTLQVTQAGFPEGRIDTGGSDEQSSLADPDRFTSLAQLYVRLVKSDVVRARMSKPIFGALVARTVTTDQDDPLPLIQLTAVSADPARALQRVRNQARAFSGYIRQNQAASGIPERKRVALKAVAGPTNPRVVTPPSKTLPLLVFLSMAIATIALVLVLENRRDRTPPRMLESVDDVDEDVVEPSEPAPAVAAQMRGRWASASGSARPRTLRSASRGKGNSSPR
jgi:hypothetical protein